MRIGLVWLTVFEELIFMAFEFSSVKDIWFVSVSGGDGNWHFSWVQLARVVQCGRRRVTSSGVGK